MSKKLKVALDDVKVEFESPLKIAGKEYTQLVLREPVVRDMKMVEHIENPMQQDLALIANLTNMTIDEMEQLPLHIYYRLQEGLKTFLS